MPDHYHQLLTHCLRDEPKAHRDAVLSKYPRHTQAIVRRALMVGLAGRLATAIIHAGANDDQLTRAERRALRRDRLAAIGETWLRDRVAAMVVEHFERRRAA